MRIVVLSDSHGFTGRLSTVLTVAEQSGPIDAILHLGDGYYDLKDLGVDLPPVYHVAGNCDHFVSGTLDLDGMWDTYVSTLEAMGLQTYVDIAQTAYTRMNS